MAALLRALGREKAARKLLLSSWREKPHALLAQAWSPVKTNKLSVAQDALALAAAAPDDIESEIYLAQTALAAGLTAEAARHANRALGKDPQNPRAKAVLTTSSGNIAPPSSAGWVCEACTATSPNWAAICQVCGKIGAITWHDMH
jgi:HemY protein